MTSELVYPASLSYQARTFTRLPSTTRVMPRSAIEANVRRQCRLRRVLHRLRRRCQTNEAASLPRAEWRSPLPVVARFAIKVMSAIEPAGTGTRSEMPSNFPASDVYACVTAIAAPVEVGTMFCAAADPLSCPSSKDHPRAPDSPCTHASLKESLFRFLSLHPVLQSPDLPSSSCRMRCSSSRTWQASSLLLRVDTHEHGRRRVRPPIFSAFHRRRNDHASRTCSDMRLRFFIVGKESR